jgi:hypothetical protein
MRAALLSLCRLRDPALEYRAARAEKADYEEENAALSSCAGALCEKKPEALHAICAYFVCFCALHRELIGCCICIMQIAPDAIYA